MVASDPILGIAIGRPHEAGGLVLRERTEAQGEWN